MKYAFNFPFSELACRAAGLACLLFMAACATDGPTSPVADQGRLDESATPVQVTNAEVSRPDSLRPDALRVGELVGIEFSGVSLPPPRHEEKIKMDGKITLPDIGPVQAAGRTRGELQQAIHDLYVPNYYKQLTVVVRNEGRYFYVKGQVNNPSQFQYLKELTLLQAIATAGDFTDFAKKTKVQITRADGRKITVNAVKALRDRRLDVPIYPDDTIEVPRRYF